jgi:EpsI family protein
MNEPPAATVSTPPPPTAPSTEPSPGKPRGPGVLQLGLVVAVLAAGVLLTALTADVTRVSEPGIRLHDGQPFLPESAGAWTGGEMTGLTPEERAVLPADTEGVRRRYTDAAGHVVYCSVVLSGRDVTSIHRPELCLTGQGWKLDAAQTEKIAVAGVPGGVLPVSRMNSSSQWQLKNGQTATAYAVFIYWFVGKDRTTPHHWERIWWTTLDRVFFNRNHRWAYFLINSVVPPDRAGSNPGAAQDESMRVISGFVQEIYPQLAAP